MATYEHSYNLFGANKKLCFLNYKNSCLLVVLNYEDKLLESLEEKKEESSNNRIAHLYADCYKNQPPSLERIIVPGFVEKEEWCVNQQGDIVRAFVVQPVQKEEKKQLKRFLKHKGLEYKLTFW